MAMPLPVQNGHGAASATAVSPPCPGLVQVQTLDASSTPKEVRVSPLHVIPKLQKGSPEQSSIQKNMLSSDLHTAKGFVKSEHLSEIGQIPGWTECLRTLIYT